MGAPHRIPSEIFRASDLRGRVPDQINPSVAMALGITLAKVFPQGSIGVGFDTRESSAELAEALTLGLGRKGRSVLNLGQCPTEIVAYAVQNGFVQAGVMVTASHNPEPDNGFKFFGGTQTKGNVRALLDQVHADFKQRALPVPTLPISRQVKDLSLIDQFVDALAGSRGFASSHQLLALNGLNGTAKLVAQPLAERLGLNVTWLRDQAQALPVVGPDPLKAPLVSEMTRFVRASGAHLGVVWDGDCDRCVFFDETGSILANAHTMAMMMDHFLGGHHDGRVVYDAKLVLSTERAIKRHSGIGIKVATGSSSMREAMSRVGAVYGGESSAHHYFGELGGIDSGMLAFVTMLDLIGSAEASLTDVAEDYRTEVAVAPELSFKVQDVAGVIAALEGALAPDDVDPQLGGLRSYTESETFRMSMGPSTTEDFMRFNFESTEGGNALGKKSAQIIDLIEPFVLAPATDVALSL